MVFNRPSAFHKRRCQWCWMGPVLYRWQSANGLECGQYFLRTLLFETMHGLAVLMINVVDGLECFQNSSRNANWHVIAIGQYLAILAALCMGPFIIYIFSHFLCPHILYIDSNLPIHVLWKHGLETPISHPAISVTPHVHLYIISVGSCI